MPLSMREITRDVWNTNLEEAMRDLRRLVDAYPYIAIDCEFPAVVARPIGKFKTSTDYHYQTMRCNVDILRLIQLGITLVNEDGQVAQDCTWQFNFYFNTDEDTYEPASIEALSKAGLDFGRHRSHGIQPNDFAELMITSGLVLSDETTWISYHGAYDFAFLLRTLTNAPLPLTEEEFFATIKVWFPALYDIKYIMRQIKPSLKGGLADVATDLGVGGLPAPPQTSATTSYLLATTYHTLLDHYILPATTRWDISAFQGALYGLGSTYISGTLDNSRTTLTSAERERPGQNGHANTNSMGSSSGVGMHGLGGGVLGSGVLGGVSGMGGMVGLGGLMSPNQPNMHAQTGHLTSAQQYHAQLQLAAAAAGGHGHHAMGGVLPMHHGHGMHHGHHHGHGAGNLGPLGALPNQLPHLSNPTSLNSSTLSSTSTGTTNPPVQTPGAGTQAQGLLPQGQSQGQAGQGVYGMVPGNYVPGYMGQMGMGGYGVGNMGNMGYFGRDR